MTYSKPSILRLLSLLLIASLGLLMGSCTTGGKNSHVIRVHITTRGADLNHLSQVVALPVSGMEYTVFSRPALIETQIENIELVKLPLGKGIMIQYDVMGMRELYRATVSNMGQSLILMLNGQPIGVRNIDSVIENGNLVSYVEIADADLDELVVSLKRTLEKVQKMR